MLTIFTPTYNRAHTLPRLYKSLQQQDCFDFEWIVINDGSSDNTDELFSQWLSDANPFPIHYQLVENGGKQRAINKAVEMAHGEYFFIVDSDDALCANAVSFVIEAFSTLPDDKSFIGISGVKANLLGNPLNGAPKIDPNIGYVDCSNLERSKYNLQADMAEAFYTAKLKEYKFPVWDNENFTPEAVVWDKMALDGYKLRWFDKVIYLGDYQEDGLTKGSWRLLKNNPMGYAMLFNTQLQYIRGVKNILNHVLLFDCQCCLGKQYSYIFKCTYPLLASFMAPFGWALSMRRRRQFKSHI